MIKKGIGVFTTLTLLTASAAAHAGSAPKELYGKSIIVTWTESRSGKSASEQIMRNLGMSGRLSIYISTAGRPFVRVRQVGIGSGSRYKGSFTSTGTSMFETAPGQSAARDHVDFEGRRIVVHREFKSGARQIAIDLEGAGCKANIVIGKQVGRSTLQAGRGVFEASSIQAGNASCSIQDGNVFGQ